MLYRGRCSTKNTPRGWVRDHIKGPFNHYIKDHAPTLAAAALALALTTGTGAALAQTSPAHTFNIPAQSIETALKEFARQANIEVLFAGDDVAKLASREVSDAPTRDIAIARLLAGTGLVFAFENDLLVVRLPEKGSERINALNFSNDKQFAQASGTLARTKVAKDDDENEGVDEIVVTGSHIRGTDTSIGSKLETITREEIEQAGFGTVPEIMQSLTGNFKGGISEDSPTSANDANLSGGTSINLRGLGAGTTLILLNGRRLAPGGVLGDFVDISNIPASLIERIEVLADGASATYGSDAIGGVVNVILRDDFEGVETGLRIGAVTEGSSQEYRANQIFGKSWDSGRALISYEYYNRGGLAYGDRSFTADSDLSSLGGDNFRTDAGVPGTITRVTLADGTNVDGQWAIPAGQDGTSLTSGDLILGQVNLFNQNQGRDLLNDQERHGVFATVTQELGDVFEIFAEARYSDRDFQRRRPGIPITLTVPSTNPWFVDPFGGSSSVRIRYNTALDFSDLNIDGSTKTFNSVLGTKFDLWSDWEVQAYGSYNSERRQSANFTISSGALSAALADPDPATAFNPFGDGSFQQNPNTLRSIPSPLTRRGESKIWTGNLAANGSLFQLPGGQAKLAIGANYDKYTLYSFSEVAATRTEFDLERRVVALFGEILVPFFGKENRRPGLERLIFTASARHEDYDDVGETTNPKYGLAWTPTEGLDIRGSYGTSFRAPDLRELETTTNQMIIFTVPDPASISGVANSLFLTGNSKLENETAKTWTVGFDYASSSLPGLVFGLTYYDIDFEDRITRASVALAILTQEDRFAAVITRNPTQAQIDTACDGEGQYLDFFGFGPCKAAPIGVIADLRTVNAAITKTDGIDFDVRYGFEKEGFGRLDFHVGGTYILSFDEAFGATAPVSELVDTVGNPIDLRLRNSVTWSDQNGLSASAFLNYSDSYKDNVSSPERKIDSWATVDLTLAYFTEKNSSVVGLTDTLISLSVRNLFDADPPFVNNERAFSGGFGYDPENASPLGRFLSFKLTKKW